MKSRKKTPIDCIRPGDVVRLRSGGPVMTVVGISVYNSTTGVLRPACGSELAGQLYADRGNHQVQVLCLWFNGPRAQFEDRYVPYESVRKVKMAKAGRCSWALSNGKRCGKPTHGSPDGLCTWPHD